MPQETAEQLRQPSVEYVVINIAALEDEYHLCLDDWLKTQGAQIIARNLAVNASGGAVDWYVCLAAA